MVATKLNLSANSKNPRSSMGARRPPNAFEREIDRLKNAEDDDSKLMLRLVNLLYEGYAKSLSELVERLGIESGLSDDQVWMEIGSKLAAEQPQFNRKKVGRPRKKRSRASELVDLVDFARKHPGLTGLTDTQILASAKLMAKTYRDEGKPFPQDALFHSTLESLRQSLSRGRKAKIEGKAQ